MNAQNSFNSAFSLNDNSLRYGPAFVGVGPEKTGTTWIYKHLNAHPGVSCAPVKELRYFWENMTFPNERFFSRVFNKSRWHTVQYRAFVRDRFRTYLSNPTALKDRKRLIWDLKYLFAKHDDKWYLSSFDNSQGYVSGEISPQYFFLPEQEIARICKLLPQTKFIISLRYPSEWAWSFARMMVRVRLVEDTEKHIKEFIISLLNEKPFTKNLQIWQKYVPDNRLKVVYFDQLQENPYEFYSTICEFLELQPGPSDNADFKTAVNEGNRLDVPDVFRPILSEGWKEEIKSLNDILPDLPQNWLTRSI